MKRILFCRKPRLKIGLKFACLIMMAALLGTGRNLFAEGIKLALIAPEGSTWVNVMREMGDELKRRTEGRLELKIYAGGVAGDEKVVVKKMEIGQIDAAGFTGVGLGDIYPPIRVLELPFLFGDAKQVDFVVERLIPDIKAGLARKGYEFLGWAEAGFVHIFSNKPITGLKDMKGVKMWMWQGDPLAEKMYETLGIVPVPLAIPDVLVALETGMINGVYAPPLGAIAMQWFAKTKYMSDAKLVNSIGALLISKRAMARMGAADQTALREVASKYCGKLVDLTRRDNLRSIETLVQSGVEVVRVDPTSLSELVSKSRRVWEDLAGSLYPKALLDKTLAIRDQYK